MIYFSPKTSKKLEEMGLESVFGTYETDYYSRMTTLDICEIENAKKLWGFSDEGGDIENPWRWNLVDYITLSDEDRVKYVEGYLTITSDK